MNKSIFAIVISAMMVLAVTAASRNAYAHTFSGDESASFLAMVEQIKVQTALVKSNLANGTLASEHAEHAAAAISNDTIKELAERNMRISTDLPASLEELKTAVGASPNPQNVSQIITNIDNLLAEATSVRIERPQIANTTVQALVVYDLLNEVSEHYAGAYGVEEESANETNLSTAQENTSSAAGTHPSNATGNASSTIVNMADYQSAQAFANRTQELFIQLKSKAPANASQSITVLDSAFADLVKAIDDKAPNDDVQAIIHAKIQPNLQNAFGLKLAAAPE